MPSWLPSLVVFGVTAVLVVVAAVALRRAGARRERRELAATADAEVGAKQLLVRADDAVRDAEREIAYAEAQFGAATARETRVAVERARARLREAFLLQQRLDDAEHDTAAERRGRAARIDDLCRSALAELDAAGEALAVRRRRERGAGAELPALREDVAELRRRVDAMDTVLGRLAARYDESALGSTRAAAERARAGLAEAASVLSEADRLVEGGLPAAEAIARGADASSRARRDLDELEAAEASLTAAVGEAAIAAAELDAELRGAREQRDALDDAETAIRLGVAIDEHAVVLADRAALAGDPMLDRDRLRSARERLASARASARTAQGRLDGARSALDGAISIAEGQVAAARAAIERGGGRVGAAARTRLAEAERQLRVARDESDPVAALDAARRSNARASDAEALARYDALGR